MKEKDIASMISAIKNANVDEGMINKLKKEVDKKGLDSKVSDLEKEYSPKLQELMEENNNFEGLSNEEKARLIIEYKDKLSDKDKKQFSKILKMINMYNKANS